MARLGVKMFKCYRRKELAELRPYVFNEELDGVSISKPDLEAGSPKLGDRLHATLKTIETSG